MSQKLITPLVIAVPLAATAIFAGANAYAGSWDEKIEMCATAAEDEGLVDLSEYRPEFNGGTSRRLSLVFESRGGDAIEVECRIARGRVVSVDVSA